MLHNLSCLKLGLCSTSLSESISYVKFLFLDWCIAEVLHCENGFTELNFSKRFPIYVESYLGFNF